MITRLVARTRCIGLMRPGGAVFERRLTELGLVLPEPPKMPVGVATAFSWVQLVNGFSEVFLDVFGQDVGQHARTAVGVAALPLNLPVVVAAELRYRAPDPGSRGASPGQ